ncbi:MAG: prepilin-type N-terminal cleavage/methylation domain-containing protein [Verrucomicrobiae bacterium]|nr:prepilin-type N-terminal cleavage/methylation domain-containing protein [Verrucomicrobiae bacterium]
MSHRRGGFTLMELMVVIAIIAILCALLFPALSGAMRKARQVACMNSIKQVSLWRAMYTSDSGRLLSFSNHIDFAGEWASKLTEYSKEQRSLFCPTAPDRKPHPPTGDRMGTADRAWVRATVAPRIVYASSYGYNAWLYSDSDLFRDRYFEGRHKEGGFQSEDGIPYPAMTPAFVDANWVDLSPEVSDSRYEDLYNGFPYWVRPGNQMARCLLARHGNVNRAPKALPRGTPMPGAISIVYADAHVDLVKLEHLWRQYWTKDWVSLSEPPR